MSPFLVPFLVSQSQNSVSKTLSVRVYERLRADIRSGILAPTTALRVEWLKKNYDVGATPIREALSRLAAEYFVTTEGKRGFRVAPVSMAEFNELTSLRDNIEQKAIEMAIQLGDDEWESTIVAYYHKLSKAPLSGQSNDIKILEERDVRHENFHLALISGCGSIWMLRIWLQVSAQQERYHRLAVHDAQTPVSVARDIEDEHRTIMDAIINRRGTEAGLLMLHHQRRTITAVEIWAKKNNL